MRIAVDAMGGDLGPGVVVQGALRALRALAPGTRLLLVGREPELRATLGSTYDTNAIEIVHAPDVIGMHEAPAAAVRRKPGASVAVAIGLVQEGRAEGVVSPG